MSKYTYKYSRPQPRTQELHPIWRGIGCILIVVVPLLSCGLATWVIPSIIYLYELPAWVTDPIVLPNFLFGFPVLVNLLAPLTYIEMPVAKLLLTLLLTLLLGGLLSAVYSIVYSIIGPPRYSDIDAPQPKVKLKPYKR